jgi:hypothetical protein
MTSGGSVPVRAIALVCDGGSAPPILPAALLLLLGANSFGRDVLLTAAIRPAQGSSR